MLIGFLSLEALYLGMRSLGPLRQAASGFLMCYAAALLIYLAVGWAVVRSPTKPTRGLLLGVLLGAIVFRLTLVSLAPSLSDDIYRYLWDGRVQQAGINPYQYAPQDDALLALRDSAWSFINHKDIPTIYPPLMQGMFRLGAWLSPSIEMQKYLFLLCDVAVMVLLAWMLPRWSLNPLHCLFYAWHPLVVVEVAGSGHHDPFGVVWLLLGLWLWKTRRLLSATLMFALAFLAKLATVVLIPFYALRAPRWLFLFAAAIVLGYLPFAGRAHLVPGVGHYTRSWEFNSSLYGLLQGFLGSPLPARAACAFGLLLVGTIMAWRSDDLVLYTQRMMQTAVLFAPVVEPWYMIWLVPLLCLRFSWAWLIFSGLVGFSYMVLVQWVTHGLWHVPTWVKWVEYGPLYGSLIFAWWKRTR